MKNTIFFLFCFITNIAFAQKSYNEIEAGVNISSMGYDYKLIGANVQTFSEFKNSKIGFNVGYSYNQRIAKALYGVIGIEFKTLNSDIVRPHYYNSPIFLIGVIKEDLHFSRIQTPLGLKYRFPDHNGNHFFVSANADLIFSNKVKREIQYAVPFPTGDSLQSISLKQQAKFGSGSSVGSSLGLGAGYQFKINKCKFFAALDYSADLSKVRIYTLDNIEDKSYFISKYKSVIVKIGYVF